MISLYEVTVWLVLLGILIGCFSLFNIWVGCKEDQLEEYIEEKWGVKPSTMRDMYKRYQDTCHRIARAPVSYIQYLKDFSEEPEND